MNGQLTGFGSVQLPLWCFVFGSFALAARRAAVAGRRGRAAGLRRRLDPTSGVDRAPRPSVVQRWARASWPIRVACTLGAGALGAVAVGPLGIIAAVAAAAIASLAQWAHRLGDARRYDVALIAVVEGLARHLRSGATVPMALADLATRTDGPLGRDLLRLQRDVESGCCTIAAAFRRWSEQCDRRTVRAFAAVVSLGLQSGGLQAQVVDAFADALRQNDRTHRELIAQAAQAKASALVMVIAPLLFAALLAASDPGARRFLAHDPFGLGCVAVGLALDLAAAASMVRIVIGHRP